MCDSSENTLAHAFIDLFSERIIHIPQLFTAVRLVHPCQITLGPIRKFHLYYTSAWRHSEDGALQTKWLLLVSCRYQQWWLLLDRPYILHVEYITKLSKWSVYLPCIFSSKEFARLQECKTSKGVEILEKSLGYSLVRSLFKFMTWIFFFSDEPSSRIAIGVRVIIQKSDISLIVSMILNVSLNKILPAACHCYLILKDHQLFPLTVEADCI